MADGDYLDETHQRISEFAAEFLDDDDERESFVDGLMERRGYQRATHWTAPEPDPKAKPGLLKQGQGAKPQGGGKAQGSYFKR
jgi:hypothetical protein